MQQFWGRIAQEAPLPLIVSVVIILGFARIFKEYLESESYSQVLKNRYFQSLTLIVFLLLLFWYGRDWVQSIKNETLVKIAVTPYGGFDEEKLAKKLTNNLKNRSTCYKYKFIEAFSYESIFSMLGDADCNSKIADLAFVSPYTWIYHYKRGKIPDYLKIIGIKGRLKFEGIDKPMKYYVTKGIYTKNIKDDIRDIKIFTKYLEDNSKNVILLFGNSMSTSTFRIPRIILYELGLGHLSYISKDRSYIKELLTKYKNSADKSKMPRYIAFISDEDCIAGGYDVDDDFGVIDFNVKIPYDPILVNSKCSNNQFEKKSLIEDLENAGIAYKSNSWDIEYQWFIRYITSGIVTISPTHKASSKHNLIFYVSNLPDSYSELDELMSNPNNYKDQPLRLVKYTWGETSAGPKIEEINNKAFFVQSLGDGFAEFRIPESHKLIGNDSISTHDYFLGYHVEMNK